MTNSDITPAAYTIQSGTMTDQVIGIDRVSQKLEITQRLMEETDFSTEAGRDILNDILFSCITDLNDISEGLNRKMEAG